MEESLLSVGTTGRSNALNLSDFECLWSEVFTTNPKYFIASLYLPPDPVYADSDLLAHLTETCELIFASEPNARINIAGDINHLNIRFNLST